EAEATAAAAANPEQVLDELPDELNSFTFSSMMRDRYPYYTFDAFRIDGFLDEVKQMDSDLTVSELTGALDRFTDLFARYRAYKNASNIRMNPFTEVRHMLYLYKPTIFDRLLYPKQRDALLEWINRGTDDESSLLELLDRNDLIEQPPEPRSGLRF